MHHPRSCCYWHAPLITTGGPCCIGRMHKPLACCHFGQKSSPLKYMVFELTQCDKNNLITLQPWLDPVAHTSVIP